MDQPRETRRQPEQSWDTFSDWVRAHAASLLNPLVRVLARHGVQPNTVTIVGCLLQVAIGLLFAQGHIRWGGVLLLIVAPLDALDGAVARARGTDGPFGAFLDSTLDRFSDASLILGLTWHQIARGARLETGLLLVALVSALLVSYTRARAEALDLSCKVGLLTRMERIFLIAVLSTLGLITPLAWALAILSSLTVAQRILHVYRTSSSN